GVAVLALVWSPVRFGRGWDVAVHTFDLFVFALLASLTDVVTSPFFASFTFLVVSATLRWRTRGAVLTVLVAVAAYVAVALYGGRVLGLAAFRLNLVAVRVIYLVGIATLLGFFGAIQQRSHVELVRLASWPR